MLHLITFTKYMTAENVIVAEIFVTADTHFYHSGILKHGRGEFFESEEAMTAALVQNWVANVPKNAIVYHLGDFSFGTKSQTIEVVKELTGEIHLVRGNHDPKKEWFESLFASVRDYRELRIEGQKIVMSHYPFLTWNGAHRGAWMWHGHSHHGLTPTTQPRLDVGVDGPGYGFAPLSFDEVAEIMRDRVYTPVDHHAPKEAG